MLDDEFGFYLKNQQQLVDQYNGRCLVIKDKTVLADFDTKIEAYEWGASRFEVGTFLIQKCSPGDKDYTITFHSRVSVA